MTHAKSSPFHMWLRPVLATGLLSFVLALARACFMSA
jgi:hypothetical protein